jgi:ketosteroid isomerase-like protein
MRNARAIPDVTIGPGTLAGNGVYAARAFAAGELVVPYDLTELTQTEFDELPTGEREWTHSFHGRIFLFPEPERYVNHSDEPSTYPDHTRGGNVALRSIRAGEAITIDDRRELQYELDTFLSAYENACNSRAFAELAPLIAEDAVSWCPDGAREGRSAIQRTFEDAWTSSENWHCAITDVAWVATNYWISACTFAFTSGSTVDGRATAVLRRLSGSWRVVHQHLSTPVRISPRRT